MHSTITYGVEASKPNQNLRIKLLAAEVIFFNFRENVPRREK